MINAGGVTNSRRRLVHRARITYHATVLAGANVGTQCWARWVWLRAGASSYGGGRDSSEGEGQKDPVLPGIEVGSEHFDRLCMNQDIVLILSMWRLFWPSAPGALMRGRHGNWEILRRGCWAA